MSSTSSTVRFPSLKTSLPKSFLSTSSSSSSLDGRSGSGPSSSTTSTSLLPMIASSAGKSHTAAASVALLHSELASRTAETSEMVKYFESEIRRKEEIFARLTKQLNQTKEIHDEELTSLQSLFQSNLASMESIFLRKEGFYLSKQRELEARINSLQDYQRLKDKLNNELERMKRIITEKETSWDNEMKRMEQEFIQEKEKFVVKMKNEMAMEIGIAAGEGGRTLSAVLDPASFVGSPASATFRQRLVGELTDENAQVKWQHGVNSVTLVTAESETKWLTNRNAKLKESIKELTREIELVDQQERIYEKRFAAQKKKIEEIEEVNKQLESEIMQLMRKVEEARVGVQANALVIIEPLNQRVAELKENASREEEINRSVRERAKRLIEQRKEMNTFFVEFLDQIESEKKQIRGKVEKESKAKLRDSLLTLAKPGGAAKLQKQAKKDEAELQRGSSAEAHTRATALDLAEKERLVRFLYAKVCKANLGSNTPLPPHSFDQTVQESSNAPQSDAPAALRLMPGEEEMKRLA